MVRMMMASRAEGFGAEVKRRIMLGTFALSAGYADQYYNKALQVRRKIRGDFDAAFQEVDVLLGPTSPTPGFQAGRAHGRPAGDVSLGYLHDHGQPGRHPGNQHPVRTDQGEPADRPAAFGRAVCRGTIVAHRPGVRARDRLAPETAGVGIMAGGSKISTPGALLADLLLAAADRLQDAELLFANGSFASAIAMGVYSLEIHLKVLICKRLNLKALPSAFEIHDLDGLLVLCGLQAALKSAPSAVERNWTDIVKQSLINKRFQIPAIQQLDSNPGSSRSFSNFVTRLTEFCHGS